MSPETNESNTLIAILVLNVWNIFSLVGSNFIRNSSYPDTIKDDLNLNLNLENIFGAAKIEAETKLIPK